MARRFRKQDKKDQRDNVRSKSNKGAQSPRTAKKDQDYKGQNPEYDTNNPEWYTRFKELIKDAVSVSYAFPSGTNIPISMADYNVNNSADPISAGGRAVPGVVMLDSQMFVPMSVSAQDVVNVSGTNTFLFLRRGKSGNAPYDAADISCLLFATAHLFSAITWAQRIYGLAQVYSTTNKYLPRTILEMEHLDVANIIRHMGDLRYGINQIIHKAAALTLPDQKQVPLYAREAFMYSNVYIESESIKDQVYVHHPLGFYKYTPVLDPISGLYVPKLIVKRVAPAGSPAWTVDDILDYLDDLMEFIYGDTDVATMMSDISNAYAGNTIKMMLLDENYMIIPTYDKFVLDQIHNAEMPGIEFYDPDNFAAETSVDPSQNSFLMSTPQLKVGTAAEELYKDFITRINTSHGLTQRFVLADETSPSDDWFVDITRFMPTYVDATGAGGGTPVIAFETGVEVIFRARVGRFAYSDDPTAIKLEQTFYALLNGTGFNHGNQSPAGCYPFAQVSTAFSCRYMPKLFFNAKSSTPSIATDILPLPMLCWNNYGILFEKSLKHLNNACLFGLLSLPLDNIL